MLTKKVTLFLAISVAVALAIPLLPPQPAQSKPIPQLQYQCVTDVLSRFPSGDVALYKVCPERDSNTLKWRAHGAVWCQNSNIQSVNCGKIYGAQVESTLLKNGVEIQIKGPNYYGDVVNTPIKNFNSPWQCGGTALGRYQVVFNYFRVNSRFGENGTTKGIRTSELTNNMGSCPAA